MYMYMYVYMHKYKIYTLIFVCVYVYVYLFKRVYESRESICDCLCMYVGSQDNVCLRHVFIRTGLHANKRIRTSL